MARYFTTGHLWIDVEGGLAKVGLTDRGQSLLGELVLVQVPLPGCTLAKGEPAVLVESVKAATEIASPLGGTILQGNAAAEDDPGLVNAAPENAGWLFRLTLADRTELNGLMDDAAYRQFVAGIA